MNGADVPFFEFLTLYFALRAVRGKPGPLRSVAWLGLTVGLGLCFYTPYRLFVIAGVLFLLIMLARRYLFPRGTNLTGGDAALPQRDAGLSQRDAALPHRDAGSVAQQGSGEKTGQGKKGRA